MDWYFGSGIDDLVVPKDQDLSDRLPSPGSWSKWGISAPESFELSNRCFINANLTQEELNFNGKILCNEVEMESSSHDHDQDQSSSLSVAGGLSDDSFNQAALSCNQPDCQLDGLAGIDQMDDIFLGSVLEELPWSENLRKPFCFPLESQNGLLPADNLLTSMDLDSQSISSDTHSLGSSKYLKTHAFSPSMGWEKGVVPDFQFSSRNSEQSNCSLVKVPLAKVLVSSEHDSINGHLDEETSLEESILQELEMVTAQLTDKTRICFRDALYRLANNSRQHTVTRNQNGDFSMETPLWTVEEEKIRSGGKKTMESETNIIDRAIASLMFNKMDLNIQDVPISAQASSKHKIVQATGPPNCGLGQPQLHGLPQSPIFHSDAEVPVLVQGFLQTRVNPDKQILRNPAEKMVQ